MELIWIIIILANFVIKFVKHVYKITTNVYHVMIDTIYNYHNVNNVIRAAITVLLTLHIVYLVLMDIKYIKTIAMYNVHKELISLILYLDVLIVLKTVQVAFLKINVYLVKQDTFYHKVNAFKLVVLITI